MMFHVERITKNLLIRGFFVFLILTAVGCAAPRPTIPINDYILLPEGKEILGREKGLTIFLFENDKTKIPFHQFVAQKYNLGNYRDIEYWVTLNGSRYKVFVYENDEIQKYYDTSQFMVSNVETEANVIGSTADFLAMSIISSSNEDCLADDSLFRNIAITYLKQLKDEYLKS
jgi:hypothetical protein